MTKTIEASIAVPVSAAALLGSLPTILTVLSILWVIVRLAQEPIVVASAKKALAGLAVLSPLVEQLTIFARAVAALALFWRKPNDQGPSKDG